MDAISLILSALTAGATAALQETAGTAIKDAYQVLLGLLKKKFSKNPKAEAALEGHADDPETWREPLEKSLKEAGAAGDQEILDAAKKIIELLKSDKLASKYNLNIEGGVQGVVVGDKATVTMNFSEKPKKRKK